MKNSNSSFIRWDVKNWSKAIQFWERKVIIKGSFYSLELGCGNNGGLSVWLSNNGHSVLCSDIYYPLEAIQFHKDLNITNIKYEEISTFNIPYKNTFDFVVVKSVFGGAKTGSMFDIGDLQLIVDEIYSSLKPNGYVLLCENAKGTFFHSFFRRRFAKKDWHYFTNKELVDAMKSKFEVDCKSVGFMGLFGWNERIRSYLGMIDNVIERLIPANFKYILIIIGKKKYV